jgi:transcriptional regulator with XRE-family HTH domain
MNFTGFEIRLLRTSRQMKQRAVAKAMGISVQRFSQLENLGRFPDKKLNQILYILGFTEESARSFLELCSPPTKK